MLFHSLHFAIFLPIVFLIYWLCPKRFRWMVLLFSSYYFYMSWNVKFVVLIFATTLISYLSALFLEHSDTKKKKKTVLWSAVGSSFAILFFFKYFNFASNSVVSLCNRFGMQLEPFLVNVLLPVGISFYIFQSVSYVIDVYRGDTPAEHHFGKYAAFVSFFPQLVAGPIERSSALLKQIKSPCDFSYERAAYGMRLMLWGFFKKIVIADGLSVYVDKIYQNTAHFSGLVLILATVFFAIQIYCDFSGYSDIATGTAKLFGIDLIKNFKTPYFSSSLKEFWNRWHISLSTWFKDYVYIPLGGNRVSNALQKRNLMITFLASGLWHGANWTFVIWGGLHGVMQLVEREFKKRETSRTALPKGFSCFLVFLFVSFAWIFFRAQTLSDAWYIITHMFQGISNPIRYLLQGYTYLGWNKVTMFFHIAQLAILFGVERRMQKEDVFESVQTFKKPLRWMVYLLICFLILIWLPVQSDSEFIYFQF